MSTDFVTTEGHATVVYNVLFDAAEYAPDQAVLLAVVAPGVPDMWATHPFDPWLFVCAKNVTNYNEAKYCFEVTVEYRSESDPLQKPWEISWTFAGSNEPVDTDADGKPMLNSSDEPFDPPLTKDVDDLVLRIVMNEPWFDPLLASEFKNALNEDWFYSFAPGCAQVKSIEATKNRAAGMEYYTVTYEIHFRWDGWQKRVLDQGYRTIASAVEGEATTYTTIKDEDGNPLSYPVKLDGKGLRLAEGAEAVFRYFDLYKYKRFEGLNLT